jgi:SAM-dependent methyltransferase
VSGDQEFWDEKYAARERVWSGRANPALVEHAGGLPPGTALDVGCGEGADVVWLAERGWRVTGLDFSPVALERARAHAGEAGLADRCRWVQADLTAGFSPDDEGIGGAADLVSVQYLHLGPADFARVYTALASAVRPGGTLLVAAHHPADRHTGLRNPDLARELFAPDQLTDLLPRAAWRIDVAGTVTRTHGDHTVTDTVVVARRAD